MVTAIVFVCFALFLAGAAALKVHYRLRRERRDRRERERILDLLDKQALERAQRRALTRGNPYTKAREALESREAGKSQDESLQRIAGSYDVETHHMQPGTYDPLYALHAVIATSAPSHEVTSYTPPDPSPSCTYDSSAYDSTPACSGGDW